MTSDNPFKDLRHLIGDGIILALLSTYAYFLTFEFEYGYCHTFDVPATLIDPSFSTVLMFATTASAISASVWYFWWMMPWEEFYKLPTKLSSRDRHWAQRLVSALFVLSAVYGVMWQLVSRFGTKHANRDAAILLFVVIIIFGVLNCIIKIIKTQSKNTDHEPRFLDYLKERYPWLSVAVPFVFLFFCLIPGPINLLGVYEAAAQNEFSLLADQENYAVVRIYGDTLIAVKYDPVRKCHMQDLIVLKDKALEKINMRYQHTGPIYRSCARLIVRK